MSEQINLQLTVNEINAILLSLAKLPYETVAQLIDKIRAQSLPQVPADQRNETDKDKMRRELAEFAGAEDAE
jgi:hypothetical protein